MPTFTKHFGFQIFLALSSNEIKLGIVFICKEISIAELKEYSTNWLHNIRISGMYMKTQPVN